MFWNPIKLHGYKIVKTTPVGSDKFWNPIKLHGYKTTSLN